MIEFLEKYEWSHWPKRRKSKDSPKMLCLFLHLHGGWWGLLEEIPRLKAPCASQQLWAWLQLGPQCSPSIFSLISSYLFSSGTISGLPCTPKTPVHSSHPLYHHVVDGLASIFTKKIGVLGYLQCLILQIAYIFLPPSFPFPPLITKGTSHLLFQVNPSISALDPI